jgi:serine/threonine protein kinase
MIDAKSLRYLRSITEDVGATAIVFLAELSDKNGRQEVAVKQMRDMEDETTIHRELCVLTSVCHDHIVKLYGIVGDAHPLQLCLEYCEGGSLFELLHITYRVPLSWSQRLKILSDTAGAIDQLHSYDPKIVHRDLKSLNILLLRRIQSQNDTPHAKVCDFGFARELEEGADMTKGAGTPQWMAPEVSSSTDYTEAADTFSFAIVAFEVVCRRVPSVSALRQEESDSKSVQVQDVRYDFLMLFAWGFGQI